MASSSYSSSLEFPTCSPYHNLTLLTHYYTRIQHRTYTNLITIHFLPEQPQGTKYIPPPLALPLIHISNEECHPSRDISTTQSTISITHNQAHIYQNNGKYLLTIPITRLQWLWTQFHFAQQQPQFLEPPLQPFEIEVIWLYQRYNYKVSQKNPTAILHYILPIPLQKFLHTTFNTTHSYFSFICSTTLTKFFFPFPRDVVFGSLGNAFHHKWMGSGYVHPNNPIDFQKVLHWARLAAHHDPLALTILIIPYPQWYHNSTPLIGPFPDTHNINIHFEADTITYKEPTIPIKLNQHPKKEPSTLHVYCIHHQDIVLFNTNNIQQLLPILHTLNILNAKIQEAQPTPLNMQVKYILQWDILHYPSLLPHNIVPPPLSNYNSNHLLKFPPEFNYYTDGLFVPPKQQDNDLWTRETSGYGIFNSIKNIEISKRLPGLQNILQAELTAIHHTLILINANYPAEPAYIFTNSLNP
jgi:hypothetical protein